MTSIRELLGSNIRTYRNNLGISQAKLAEMINIATNYLGLIEGGKKFPSACMIERIASALGKDTPDLFAVAPVQQDWKEQILLKMNALINEELKSIGPAADKARCQKAVANICTIDSEAED